MSPELQQATRDFSDACQTYKAACEAAVANGDYTNWECDPSQLIADVALSIDAVFSGAHLNRIENPSELFCELNASEWPTAQNLNHSTKGKTHE